MRVVYISASTIPSLAANSIQVMKMCAAFAQLGHEVELINPSRPDALAMGDDELREHYGVAERFPLRWLPASARLKEYDYAMRAAHVTRTLRPDLVLTRSLPAAGFCAELGLPTVLELHEPVVGMGRIRRTLFQRMIRRRSFRGLVVISDALRDRILPSLNGLPIPIAVCHDGIDLERFESGLTPREARQRLGLPEAGFTLGYSGHLYAGRGVELVYELARRFPEDRFLLVGGKPESVEEYRAKAARSGLGNVQLTGFVPNGRLPSYLAAADILLMPYQRQVSVGGGGNTVAWMSPLKMFEYLAAGRPIISSDLPVLREVLDESVALLREPDQVDAWAEAVSRLKREPELGSSLARAARERASKYSWKARAETILALGR